MGIWEIPELVNHILQCVDARTLCVCSQVNKLFHQEVQRINRLPKCFSVLSTKNQTPFAVEEVVKKGLDSPFIPDLALVFTCHLNEAEVIQGLSKRLPKRTLISGCTGWGILGNDIKGEPQEIEDKASLSVIFLRLPNSKISTFHLSAKDLQGLTNENANEFWLKLTKTPKENASQLQSLLLPVSDPNLLYYFETYYRGGLKVGGFVSTSSGGKRKVFTSTGPKTAGCSFVTFNGGVQFHVAIAHSHDVEGELAKLPKGVKYLCGFIFSCVGRGSSYHGKANAEVTVFKKLFPKVPLAGFFTGGELGPDENSTDLARYSYTSVFCLVSLLS